MADPRLTLERLLKSSDLATIVPALDPGVLHRFIQRAGLEDCAELVALATPAQLARVLDADLWRAPASGADEVFDADRFGEWIDVLMQSGPATAAEKLIALDIELAIAGFSQLAAIFHRAAVSTFTTLEGELAGGRAPHEGSSAEVGGYLIEARRETAWDAIVELLMFLAAEHPTYFHRLMRGCVTLSNGAREADGFHQDLLEDRDQDLFDLASDRETRREQLGYVTPAQARAFLQGARELRLDGDPPPPSAIARAYFRALETPLTESLMFGDAHDPSAAPRHHLLGTTAASSRLTLIEAFVQSHPESTDALAYLTNTIIAGCTIQDRPLTPREASHAAIATCNLGLENWPAHWRGCDLTTAFQVGWTTLHHGVCMSVARQLIRIIETLNCRDRDIQLRLYALGRELARHLRDGRPWRARPALEVLVMLDAASWAALLALIDEVPTMHAAVTLRNRHRINVGDFDFISQNDQRDAIGQFMASLPGALIG